MTYEKLLTKDELIKAVRMLAEKIEIVEKNQQAFVTKEELSQSKVVVIAEQPIPSTWPADSQHSMSDLINAINADETAVPGRMYLSTVRLNDLPYYEKSGGGTERLTQAEMKVEIMAREQIAANTVKDVILFTVTSSNPPYHWEYTSVWGSTGDWISFTVNE